MNKENNHFKNENEEEVPEKLKNKEQDFDIVLILGSNEELFKKYVEKIHPDIIQNKFLQLMLKHQIDEFNSNHRYVNWETVFEEVYPEKRKEEPYKENYMKLAKKYVEDISTQSPELLEKRLKSMLKKKETDRAIIVYRRTDNIEALYNHLDNARRIEEEIDVELVDKDLSEVPEKIKFLIEGRIVKGGITFIAGKGGTGKGVFTMGSIGAAVTAGGIDFEGNQLEQGFVFLFNKEDLTRTVLNRLENNGGNVENLKWLEIKKDKDGYSPIFSLKRNIPSLIRKLKQIPEELLTNSLLVIDGIGTFMGMQRGSDAYNDVDVRNVLAPLSDIAEEFNMAIVIIGHFNKTKTSDLIYAILGSKAFSDISRAVYAIIADEEEKERHYFLPLKWNIPELKNTGIEFLIEDLTDKITIVKELSAEDVEDLKAERQPGQSRSLGAGEEAKRFLAIILKDGQRSWKEINKMMKANNINQGTLYKARKKMGGIRTEYDPFGVAYWVWDRQSMKGQSSDEAETKISEDAERKVDEIRAKYPQSSENKEEEKK